MNDYQVFDARIQCPANMIITGPTMSGEYFNKSSPKYVTFYKTIFNFILDLGHQFNHQTIGMITYNYIIS